jgi:hypothetical protein
MAPTLTDLQDARAKRQLDIMERCFKANEDAKQVKLSKYEQHGQ